MNPNLKVMIIGKEKRIGTWISEGCERTYVHSQGEIARLLLYRKFDVILVTEDIGPPQETAVLLLQHYAKEFPIYFPIVALAQKSTSDAHVWMRVMEAHAHICKLPWVLTLGKNVVFTSNSKKRKKEKPDEQSAIRA